MIYVNFDHFCDFSPKRSDGKGKKEKQNVTGSSEAETGAQLAYLLKMRF